MLEIVLHRKGHRIYKAKMKSSDSNEHKVSELQDVKVEFQVETGTQSQ